MSPDIVGRLRPPRLASAPASPAPGEEYFNSTGNTLQFWNGTAWISMTPTTGGGTPVLTASQVRDVGVANQIRAGRQLTAADFTALGLSAPAGLWNLSDLTDASGNGRALTNKGAVAFTSGINGIAATAAQFTGSTAQALYISDTGAADPFRIKTGSWGCWFRTAKTGVYQHLVTKASAAAGQYCYALFLYTSNVLAAWVSPDGTAASSCLGISNVADDRWHQAVSTFDGSTQRIYVDAVLEASLSVSGAIFSGSGVLDIGAQAADGSTAASNPNFGRVDEAFVTADVLSPDQVRGLYCAKIAHTLGAVPSTFNLAVRRARKGAALDPVADFPGGQPLRLHNFTAGALTDQGTGNVTLTNNGAAVAVAGADGSANGAYNFVAASSQSLSSTDAGLPSGTGTRSWGCWLKTTSVTTSGVVAWGTINTADARFVLGSNGSLYSYSAGDNILGPYIADGQWHHAVATEDNAAGDGVKRKFYVDGLLVGGSTVLNAITLAGANRFRVGASSDGTQPFTGQVDNAFVCAYALTQDQVSTLYAKGAQQLSSSPKNAGDHVEYADSSSVYMVLDTLDSQNAVDLGVS